MESLKFKAQCGLARHRLWIYIDRELHNVDFSRQQRRDCLLPRVSGEWRLSEYEVTH